MNFPENNLNIKIVQVKYMFFFFAITFINFMGNALQVPFIS